MNSILTYDRSIRIFDGAIGTLVSKGDFQFTDEVIKRDATQNVVSELTINDVNDVVNNLDIIFIANHLGIAICGRIVSVERIENGSPYKVIKFNYGADTYTNEVYLENNTLVPNFTENNNQILDLTINTSESVTTSNNFLATDTLCRQALRRGPCKEEMIITPTKLEVNITDSPAITIGEFRINDTDITDKVVVFADDQYNILRLYNQEDKSQSVTYYLAADGSVSTDIADAQYPNIVNYEVVEADKYNNLSFARDKIKQQEYNNKIEFSIPFDTNIKALKFDDTFLGRKVNVYFDDSTYITTIISAYEIIKNVGLKVKLGLTRTKLTERLKKED